MKKILISLSLLSVALHAQVNVKGKTVDATVGYTYQGGATNNFVLCGVGGLFIPQATCGTVANPFYQSVSQNSVPLPQRFNTDYTGNFHVTDEAGASTLIDLATTINSNTTGNAASATTSNNSAAVGGVALSGLCQTSGTGCPANGITGSTAGSGWIKFPTGLIIQWMPGPSVTQSGVSINSGSWPIPFPNAIFGATCSTTTAQGNVGSPGDTDIHVMEMSSQSTSGWSVRHSVGGVYSQAQTVSCFLTAVGN